MTRVPPRVALWVCAALLATSIVPVHAAPSHHKHPLSWMSATDAAVLLQTPPAPAPHCVADVSRVSATTVVGPANDSSWATWTQFAVRQTELSPGVREYAVRDGKHVPMNVMLNDTEVGLHTVTLYTLAPRLLCSAVAIQTWTYTIVPSHASQPALEMWGLPAFQPMPWTTDDAPHARDVSPTPVTDTSPLAAGGAFLQLTVPEQALAGLNVPITAVLKTTVTASGDKLPTRVTTLRHNCDMMMNLTFTNEADPDASPARFGVTIPLKRGMGSTVLDISSMPGFLVTYGTVVTVCGFHVPVGAKHSAARNSPRSTRVLRGVDDWVSVPTNHTVPTSAFNPETGVASEEVEVPPGIVVIPSADLTVAEGASLTFGPGTTIVMPAGANLFCKNNASLVFRGTADHPIIVQPNSNRHNWGGVVAFSGCRVTAHHTMFVGGASGQGSAVGYGHRTERPLFRLFPRSNTALWDSALLNGVGQAFGAEEATLRLNSVLVRGFVTGGQLDRCTVRIRESTFTDFPSATQVYRGDEDNDGLYIVGGDVHLLESAFMFAKDDCLDSGTGSGGRLLVQHCWFEHCLHEAVALSNTEPGKVAGVDTVPDDEATTAKFVVVEHSAVLHSQQGVELGFSTSRLWAWVHACLFMDNDVGVRYSDAYGWQTAGFMHVSDSVFAGNKRDWLNRDVKYNGRPTPGLRLAITGSAFNAQLVPSDVRDGGTMLADNGVWWADGGVRPAVLRQVVRVGRGGGELGPQGLHHAWGDPIGVDCTRDTAVGTLSVTAAIDTALASQPAWDGESAPPRYRNEPPLWTVHRFCSIHSCSCATRRAAAVLAAPADQAADPGAVPPPVPEDDEPASGVCGHDDVAAVAAGRMDGPWVGSRFYETPHLMGAGSSSSSDDAPPPPTLQSLPLLYPTSRPEIHVVIVWSEAGTAATEDIVRMLWHESESPDSSIVVHGMRTVSEFDLPPHIDPNDSMAHIAAMTTSCPRQVFPLSEEWFKALYGTKYYLTSYTNPDGTPGEYQGMHETKGAGPAVVALVEDPAPLLGHRPGKGLVNINLYELKWKLRQMLPRPGSFLVHASHTLAEGLEDVGFLFGTTDPGLLNRIITYGGPTETACMHTHHSRRWNTLVTSATLTEVVIALGRSDFFTMMLPNDDIVLRSKRVLFPETLPDVPPVDVNNLEMATLKKMLFWFGTDRITLLLTLPDNMKWFSYFGTFQQLRQMLIMPTEELHANIPWGLGCGTVEAHARHRLLELGMSVLESGSVRLGPPVADALDAEVMGHVMRLLPQCASLDATFTLITQSPFQPLITIWDGNHRAIALVMLDLMCQHVIFDAAGQAWLHQRFDPDQVKAMEAACPRYSNAVRFQLGVSPDLDINQATCPTCSPIYCNGKEYLIGQPMPRV